MFIYNFLKNNLLQKNSFDTRDISAISPSGIRIYCDYVLTDKPADGSKVVKTNCNLKFTKRDGEPFTNAEYNSILTAYTAAQAADREVSIDVNI